MHNTLLPSIKPGTILESSIIMDEPIFTNTQILLAKTNPDVIGFVLNKPSGKYLNQLVEFSHMPAIPLYWGGPVQNDYLYIIHQHAAQINGAEIIVGNYYLGGSMKNYCTGVLKKLIQPQHTLCFLGYCGWDEYQLLQEITEGYWNLQNTTIEQIITPTER